MPANHISHTLIRPVGKIEIENFHMFDIHWLYRTSGYAIFNVEDEHNDVTKRQGIVIRIWRTSAIEGTALSKTPHSEMKGVQEKESIMGVRGRQNTIPRDHNLTSLGQPRDTRQ